MNFRIFLNAFFAFCLSFLAESAFADDNPPPVVPPTETTEQKLAAALKRQEELENENKELKNGKKKESDPPPDDLVEKNRRDSEARDKKASETKEVERALKFNLTVDDFVKDNKSFLPEEIDGILALAKKENYDSEFQKATKLKAAMIKSYFSVQSNFDSLSPSHRASVEKWRTLTQSAREEKAPDLFENVFEPCIETFRRVKKAEEVGRARAGYATKSDSNDSYKQRLIAGSRAAHLGEKKA